MKEVDAEPVKDDWVFKCQQIIYRKTIIKTFKVYVLISI